jgi:hypothetical protein
VSGPARASASDTPGSAVAGGVAGGKGVGRSYWSWGHFLSGRSASPAAPRPRLPEGNGGPGRLRGMMEMVGGGLAARSEGDARPHLAASLLPRRGFRAGPPGPRRHLPDIQHNDHSTPPPGLRTRRRDAVRRVPAISAPSVHRRTRRERRAPWSSSQRQSSNPSCMWFEFMPIRPVLAGTNASNLTARGVSRPIGANKPAYKQTEVEKARPTLTGPGTRSTNKASSARRTPGQCKAAEGRPEASKKYLAIGPYPPSTK